MNGSETQTRLWMDAETVVIDYEWRGYSPPGPYQTQGQDPTVTRTFLNGPHVTAIVTEMMGSPDDLHDLRSALELCGLSLRGTSRQHSHQHGHYNPLWREVWALNPGRADVILEGATHLSERRSTYAAQLSTSGYRPVGPTPEAADIDAHVAARIKCPRGCGHLHYEPWSTAGSYVALAVCAVCNYELEF